MFVHASLTRTFAGNLLGSEQYHIIQLNNRSVKDRSFSRKIESERSFFVSESHRIDAQLKTVIDRTLARWTKVRNKEFYYIMKCADDNRAAMETTLACFRGYADCVSGAVEKGIIYGTGVYEKCEVSGKNVMKEAYELGKNV